MNEVTQILSAIDQGDPSASERLLPLVYEELRRLAAQRLAREPSGQTLQPTALVHEVYLRLVNVEKGQHWNSRGHFFAAAAEAMRRILVENARRKHRLKHGGGRVRIDMAEVEPVAPMEPEVLLELDEALTRLGEEDPRAAELVKLRYFVGLTGRQAAEILDISARTADFLWAYARAWLLREIQGEHHSLPSGEGS